jgi:hypothetical protein
MPTSAKHHVLDRHFNTNKPELAQLHAQDQSVIKYIY